MSAFPDRSRAPRPPDSAAGGSWAAIGGLRRLVLRLHHGWEDLPAAARRRWWLGLGAGLPAVELLVLALVWLGKRLEAAGALRWEDDALRLLESQPYLSFNTGMWLEGLANGFVLWFVVLYASGFAAWRGRPLVCLSLLTGYTLMYVVIATGWIAWDRARPTLIAEGIGSPGGVFRSFPSGHTIQAAFAYGFLGFLWLRSTRSTAERALAILLYLLLLFVVCVGRLRLGAHWPSDIVAGAVIGVAWLAAVLLTLRRAERAAAGNPAPAPRV